MKFLFFCALFLTSVGIACLAAVVRIGSYVDAEGVLHEPFALMELGAMSLALGVAVGMVCAGTAVWRRFRAS